MLTEWTSRRTLIIAEIGQNHQGDIEIAKELIRTAKLCGVDAVKSQKRDVRTLLSSEEHGRIYDNPHSFGKTYGEHRERLEFNEEQYAELKQYAESIGIIFFASPWDVPSAHLLERLAMSLYKIASASITNDALLATVASFRKPTILSTGMSTLDEIQQAVNVFEGCEYALLQCTSAYPVRFEDVHLNVINAYRNMFSCPIGLSGHHKGIAIDAAAVTLGARIIERHFTLDRTMKGTDHAASLEPPGFSRLVRDIRAIEKALGSSTKNLLECELESKKKLRKAG
jgi:sialic acid synthase